MRDRITEYTIQAFLRLRPIVLVILICLLVFTGTHLEKVYRPKPMTPLVKIAKGDAPDNDDKEKGIVVSITGEVGNPGVYSLNYDSRVSDLLIKAGGFSNKADKLFISSQLNLARVLSDGEQIYIPNLAERKLMEANTGGSGSQVSNQTSSQKINLNTASQVELETLPGVGPATAEKIMAARPFEKIDDIQNVSGIGEATFNKLKDLITV